MDVKLDVGAGAQLAWLPQETILFDRARLSRRIDVDLAEGASLLLAEAVVFGRAAMGEAMSEGLFADRWRVRRAGRLVFADSARLDGDVAAKLGAAGVGRRRHRHRHRAGRAGRRGHARRRARASNLPARSASRPGTASPWRGLSRATARACATI